MDTDILGEVIRVEKELQASLEGEKIKARERLEVAQRVSENEILKEREKLQELYREQILKANQEAEAAAASVLEKAAADTLRIEQLTDEALRRIVMRQIRAILTG